jgi:Flp pilus assembly protein CpaB
MDMSLAHIIVAVSMIVIVLLLGLGAVMAFRLSSKTATKDTVEKVNNITTKKPIAEIEDLDITKVLKRAR